MYPAKLRPTILTNTHDETIFWPTVDTFLYVLQAGDFPLGRLLGEYVTGERADYLVCRVAM